MTELARTTQDLPEAALHELAPIIGTAPEITAMPNSVGADGWLLSLDSEHVAAVMPLAEDTYRKRFNDTKHTVFRKLFSSPYVETDNYTINVLPTTEALNKYSGALNGLDHYVFVEHAGSVVQAPQFLAYLRHRQVPQATYDLNYVIHDRALDDHIPGWLITPRAVVEFVAQAATRLDDGFSQPDKNAAGSAIGAFDFLSQSLMLYSWKYFNGNDVPPPPPPAPSPIDRFSFENVDNSLRQIAEASGLPLPKSLRDNLKALVDEQAARLKQVLPYKAFE